MGEQARLVQYAGIKVGVVCAASVRDEWESLKENTPFLLQYQHAFLHSVEERTGRSHIKGQAVELFHDWEQPGCGIKQRQRRYGVGDWAEVVSRDCADQGYLSHLSADLNRLMEGQLSHTGP